MKTKQTGKIKKIIPGTTDEGDNERLFDAYVLFEINNTQIWTFMHEWKNYFPSKWKASDYLPKLMLKEFPIKLTFLDLETNKIETKEKKLYPIQDQKKPCDYYLFGEIIEKKQHQKYDFAEIVLFS